MEGLKQQLVHLGVEGVVEGGELIEDSHERAHGHMVGVVVCADLGKGQSEEVRRDGSQKHANAKGQTSSRALANSFSERCMLMSPSLSRDHRSAAGAGFVSEGQRCMAWATRLYFLEAFVRSLHRSLIPSTSFSMSPSCPGARRTQE